MALVSTKNSSVFPTMSSVSQGSSGFSRYASLSLLAPSFFIFVDYLSSRVVVGICHFCPPSGVARAFLSLLFIYGEDWILVSLACYLSMGLGTTHQRLESPLAVSPNSRAGWLTLEGNSLYVGLWALLSSDFSSSISCLLNTH